MKRLGGGVQLPNCSGYACEECPPRDSSALKARLTTKTIGEMLSRSLHADGRDRHFHMNAPSSASVAALSGKRAGYLQGPRRKSRS